MVFKLFYKKKEHQFRYVWDQAAQVPKRWTFTRQLGPALASFFINACFHSKPTIRTIKFSEKFIVCSNPRAQIHQNSD